MDTDLTDFDRYPLDRPGSDGWKALVRRCRAELARDGLFSLPDFLPEPLRLASLAALHDLRPQAFTHARTHNIYFRDLPDLPPDHPALTRFETVNHTLCTDQLAATPLAAVYHDPRLAAFLAAVMDKPALHVMQDPLAGLNVMEYRAGEALNWHFDRAEFTTTLLLQSPLAGGEFVYRRDLRSDDDPNYDGVARLLRGDDPQVVHLPLAPGTLNVFRGRNTAHRVTPAIGDQSRIIAVFSYYDRPGVTFTPAERRGFYGRAG